MKIEKVDFSKIERVREQNGKTVGRCPACALHGGDSSADHLLIRCDGDDVKLSCVANQGDRAHWKLIWEIVTGDGSVQPPPIRQAAQRPARPSLRGCEFGECSSVDARAVAESRGINPEAVALAVKLGHLSIGTFWGQMVWFVHDPQRRRLLEARRVDGKPFPAWESQDGELSIKERKSHAVRGSSKAWPLGVEAISKVPADRPLVILVEGAPDFLAVLSALLDQPEDVRRQVCQVAMLGGAAILPDALPLFSGSHVRIVPDNDANGQGERNGERWARQLTTIGCSVDVLQTEAKDINDAYVNGEDISLLFIR